MMDLARTRGIRSEECRWSVDRSYLESKANEGTEALAYNGYCFILEKETMNCITLFPLPKDFGKKKNILSNEQQEGLFEGNEVCLVVGQ